MGQQLHRDMVHAAAYAAVAQGHCGGETAGREQGWCRGETQEILLTAAGGTELRAGAKSCVLVTCQGRAGGNAGKAPGSSALPQPVHGGCSLSLCFGGFSFFLLSLILNGIIPPAKA